jgi:hypothetical protein
MSRILVLSAALLLAGPAGAKPARLSATAGEAAVAPGIFTCRLRDGKTVKVTGDGEHWVYRYGGAARPELTIVATPARGNVFKRIAVHGGDWEVQLRFVSGEYSYIVHSFPRNDIVDNVPSSGLVVFRGAKRILRRDCTPWAAISLADPGVFEGLESVPELPEGAPSAWGD